jgi:hypothetical protein
MNHPAGLRVLHVGNYPMDGGRHGGQIRAAHIEAALKNFKAEVTTLSILADDEDCLDSLKIHVPDNLEEDLKITRNPHLAPYIRGINQHIWLYSTEGQKSIDAVLGGKIFDVVVVEQPWSLISVYSYIKTRYPKTKIIYSSHNNESELIAKILLDPLKNSLIIEKELNFVKEIVKKLEDFCVKNSDEIWAVTEEDKNFLSLYDKTKKFIVAPNGARVFLETTYKDFFGLNKKYAIFVGSGHPPNISGFISLLDGAPLDIPKDFLIVCVGSVSGHVQEWAESNNLQNNFSDVLVFLPSVSKNELDLLIYNSSVILLPISYGGGSNLKTAEAIASNKTVIATRAAMRGFEPWIGAPGIYLANSIDEFKTFVKEVSQKETKTHNRIGYTNAPLFWADCLSPIFSGILKKYSS